ncbi:cysteine dioxygenase [Streptomyces parvus]|uniref:cysteine dioxygenase n=1 Tax=Streptomyces parvus TaxID=66428 RepID=UPI00344B8C38
MSSAHSTVPTAGSVPSPSSPSSTSSTVSSSASAASAASCGGAAPTIAELLEFVRRTARNEALIASLPLDPEGRTWIRLDGPGGSEAWLIGWPPGTGTGWHDHADSIGAFTTAAGALKEHSLAVRLPTDGWKTLELTDGVDRSRELATGQGRAFGQNHVHEVLNESEDVHAVSVHAYYPPLPRIRRFSRTGAVLRLEQTESPGDWQ